MVWPVGKHLPSMHNIQYPLVVVHLSSMQESWHAGIARPEPLARP